MIKAIGFAALAGAAAQAQSLPPATGHTAVSSAAALNAAVPKTQTYETIPIKSLFYTQAEMDSVHHALDIYIKRMAQNNSGEAEAFLNQLEENKSDEFGPPKKYYTYPQFFLESLAYHSPDDWSVWINHQRFTAKARPGGLGSIRVLNIDKNKASFEWMPDKWDLEKIREIPDKPHDVRIDVDYVSGIITFTLRPNQTFSTYAMQVLEGDVEPVTIKNNTDDALTNTSPSNNAPQPAATHANPPNPTASSEAAQGGLRGLIDNYKDLERFKNP